MRRLILLVVLIVTIPLFGKPIDVIIQYKDVLDTAQEKYKYNKKNDYLLIVNTAKQEMYLIKNKKVIKTYVVSTGKAGEGNAIYSRKTPLGYLKIYSKAGDNAPIGTIFVSKINTKKVATIYTDDTDSEKDFVTTRVMHLDGLQASHNKGGKVDAYKRGIYIHGTHEEGRLGLKASNGCIRMYNKDVVELFNLVPTNTIVYIA